MRILITTSRDAWVLWEHNKEHLADHMGSYLLTYLQFSVIKWADLRNSCGGFMGPFGNNINNMCRNVFDKGTHQEHYWKHVGNKILQTKKSSSSPSKPPPTTNLLGVTIVLYVDIGFCKIDVAPDFAKSYVNIGSTAESMQPFFETHAKKNFKLFFGLKVCLIITHFPLHGHSFSLKPVLKKALSIQQIDKPFFYIGFCKMGVALFEARV